MDLEIQPRAEKDLEESVAEDDTRRIIKKLEEVEKRLEIGIKPEKAVEKRLSGEWSPILQQRAGDYRIWFVEGKNTEKGKPETLYCIRVLTKKEQQKMIGADINPDAFL